MLTVYGRATSSNVQALLWGMEELDLSYDRIDCGEIYGGLDTPEFLAMNPHGRIPVLKIGETALFETGAILRYLASEHGQDAFWPAAPLARAKVDMWAEWAKYQVAARFTGPVFWQTARTAPEHRDPRLIRANIDRLETELAKAEARLGGMLFLCGSHLTLADIQLGHILYRYFDIDIDHRDMPALHGYYLRLAERRAYQKTVMVSYDELRNTF